jgi:hypothetical protein
VLNSELRRDNQVLTELAAGRLWAKNPTSSTSPWAAGYRGPDEALAGIAPGRTKDEPGTAPVRHDDPDKVAELLPYSVGCYVHYGARGTL